MMAAESSLDKFLSFLTVSKGKCLELFYMEESKIAQENYLGS